MRNSRKILAVLVFVVSLALLLWGLWPEARETLIQTIGPGEMQLPTPSSFFPSPWLAGWPLS